MKELSKYELVNISAGGYIWKFFGKAVAFIANNYDAHREDIYARAMRGEHLAD